MSAALAHRGPDGSGEYVSEHVVLAARRLAIVGLQNGDQPIISADGTLVLVVNGEIYNHIELRRRLERLGHRFQTDSDCETIIHCYKQYGDAFVDHLRGMFAFALWDASLGRLLLARDPMGEKPLLIYEHDGAIMFASEMKSLLRSGAVPFALDANAINDYFHYQYVPEPRTAVRHVRKMEAAGLWIVDTVPWKVTRTCFWRMESAPPVYQNPALALREKLADVSAFVTKADVPVGVALSGGLDSSLVAALAARDLKREIVAFTVGYAGRPAGIDERNDARLFAQHLDIPCHEIEIAVGDIVNFFPELNFWRDDPVADYSGHGYYAVMRAAHEHGVRVMLQGQGGDELFWGYPLLRRAAMESRLKKKLHTRGWGAFLDYVMAAKQDITSTSSQASIADIVAQGWTRFRRDRASAPEQMVFYDLSPDFSAAAGAGISLYDPRFAQEIASDARDLFTIPLPWPDVDTMVTSLVSATYLRCNGVVQGDRLSMANSVELRLPLLDRSLVELVIGLRAANTDLFLEPKRWLKDAVSDIVPAWVMNRPKRGFEPPVGHWHEQLFAAYGDELRSGYLADEGILNSEALDSLSAGKMVPDQSSPLSFKALVLEQWCRSMKSQAPVSH